MKSGDAIRIEFNTEYYFQNGLRLVLYPYNFTEAGVFDAWWKGRQN